MSEHIAIFGGSFNPVHFGHLSLAIEMLEKRALTSIYFCPAALNPFKENKKPIAAHHRLKMLELALEGFPQFSILENELFRPPPSYTIDTIEEVLKNEKNPIAHYYLILGEDSISGFPKWHRAEEIVQSASLLIGMRSSCKPALCTIPAIQEAILAGMTPTKTIDISSSEIRERIRQKKPCSHLLPSKVLDYIYANRLYFDS